MWKENLKNDGQQIQQYEQKEKSLGSFLNFFITIASL